MENKFRTIGYIILFAINCAFFYFLHSHFYFLMLVLMVVAPIASLAAAYGLKRTMSVRLESPYARENGFEYARQGEEIQVNLIIENKLPLLCLDAKVKVNVKNDFFGTEGVTTFAVPVRAFSGCNLSLPLIPTYSGIISIEVERILIKDLMGFHFFKYKKKCRQDIIVMPQLVDYPVYDRSIYEAGMTESEENNKRGFDYSDVSDIREYIPGDMLNNIHWKLTAKKEELMVKERIGMSEAQLIVIPELYNINHQTLNAILITTYSVIRKLVLDNVTVQLMYWCPDKFDYEETKIDYMDDLNNAFAKMYYGQTYIVYNEGASHMPGIHPEVNSYVSVYADSRGVYVTVKENS